MRPFPPRFPSLLRLGVVGLAFALAAPAAAQPADTLRVGADSLPPGRGNPYKGVGHPHIYTWAAIFDSLTVVDNSGVVQPALATGWRNIDPTTWRFQLRDGVRFSNGEPFDAPAVAAAIAYTTSEAGLATAAGRNFRGFRLAAVDARTVEIATDRPNPILPNVLASLVPLPPRAWAELGDPGFTQTPVGTGPYVLKSWAGAEALLAAYPQSWRPPVIPNLRIVALAERPARLQALMSGQVDIMIRLDADGFAAVRAAGHRIESIPGPLASVLALVHEGPNAMPQVKDRRIRQALNMAVDRPAIAQELLKGTQTLSSQPATPNAFGYNGDLKPYPYDPEAARKLLAEAGQPAGFSFRMEFTGDDSSLYQKVAADLGRVGVKVEIVPLGVSDYLAKFLRNGWDGQAFNHVFGVAPEMDAGKPMGFNTCMKDNPWYCDRAMMPLVDQINTELDTARRKALLHGFLARYREEAPGVFLFEQTEIYGVAARVKGFRNINRALQYNEMHF